MVEVGEVGEVIFVGFVYEVMCWEGWVYVVGGIGICVDCFLVLVDNVFGE